MKNVLKEIKTEPLQENTKDNCLIEVENKINKTNTTENRKENKTENQIQSNALTPNFVLVEEKTLKEDKKQEDNILKENNALDTSLKKDKENKHNIKSLTFWISLICGFIVVVQLVLNYFSIQFETKIIIEIISFVLAFLVSMGVLGSSLKNKNITQIKENIENTISSKIDNLSNKLDKSDKTK